MHIGAMGRMQGGQEPAKTQTMRAVRAGDVSTKVILHEGMRYSIRTPYERENAAALTLARSLR